MLNTGQLDGAARHWHLLHDYEYDDGRSERSTAGHTTYSRLDRPAP